ncbi:hypothetical protein B046DRAFT_05908 [Streptomyces sp. LamerLS-316]|nr:hypothetical protein B046DRAFT_05908 [Streptomyces sp. LamerLS-316]
MRSDGAAAAVEDVIAVVLAVTSCAWAIGVRRQAEDVAP